MSGVGAILEHMYQPDAEPGKCAFCEKATTRFCLNCKTHVCPECYEQHDRKAGLGLQP